MIKQILVNLTRKALLLKTERHNKRYFENWFKDIADKNGLGIKPNHDSKYADWVNKWNRFRVRPSDILYQVYSKYLDDVNCVPNDIGRNYIEPILTPYQYQPFYNDKNSFNLLVDKNDMPRTLFRSMNYHFMNSEYEIMSEDEVLKIIQDLDKFVVKPTLDMGGKGVTLFSKHDNAFIDSDGNEFSLLYLKNHFNTNYIAQECISQSAFMSQFNKTSINTLRVATYRDVDDGHIIVLGTVLRMGKSGSIVDNCCSGGVFISVDDNGKLGNYVCDSFGHKSVNHNLIDFEKQSFVIPNYEKIKDFAIRIAKRFPHMSLLANDIAITENGDPILIEINTQLFSYWLFQLSGNAVFGENTDRVIEYCVRQNKKIKLNKKISCEY